MSALRLLSSSARRTLAAGALGRRGYAEASDKLNLALVLPHQVSAVKARHDATVILTSNVHLQVLFSSSDVVQVNLAAATGDMGILANHVPSIEPLRPGLVEVVEGSGSKKWFGTCPLKLLLGT